MSLRDLLASPFSNSHAGTRHEFMEIAISSYLHGAGCTSAEIEYVTEHTMRVHGVCIKNQPVSSRNPDKALAQLAAWAQNGEGRLLLELAVCHLELYRLRGPAKAET